MVRSLVAVLLCVSLVLGEEAVRRKPTDTVITHARIHVCSIFGTAAACCLVGSLTTLTTSQNVEFNKLSGHPSVIVFMNANGEVVEDVKIEKMTRDQCNEMMLERGFRQKEKEPEKDVSDEQLGVKGEL
ncbi:hypothetical protein V5799_033343 [Amblyomma americanum]|uniref:Selenoprotein F/M domain-containing protein n=1 Tax=Amblyomma americanum TaxID=6943 RepID=A0AAQ4DNK7_AMBAM